MQVSPFAVPNLPNAITIFGNYPNTEMRIGKVVAVNSGIINVSISGATSLTQAPYAFGQYQPNLGDNVVCLRVDNQWIVLCTMSGNPTDNMITNYSFENDLASPPGDWVLYHDPVSTEAANVSAVELPVGWELDGTQAVQFQLDATPPGVSVDVLTSTAIPVTEGELWTASAWIVGDSLSSGPCARATAQLIIGFYANSTNVWPTTVASTVLASANVPSTMPWIPLRPSGDTGDGVFVPAGANHMRVSLFVNAQHDSCSTNFVFNTYWDRVVATRLS